MDKGADLIGIPFQYGGRGPESFDCYGLVMEMTRRNDVAIPDFGFAEDQGLIAAMMGATMPQWKPAVCKEGAIALIRIGRFPSHVAYVVDDERMIHAWEHSHGVSIVKIDEWKHRIVGFYEYAGS